MSSKASLIFLLLGITACVAQKEAPAEPELVSIPSIGCPADGQTGHLDAPENGSTEIHVPAETAAKLSVYTALGISVLAPRGWHCIGIYGSSGEAIIVTPEAMRPAEMFGDRRRLTGPAVALNHVGGEGSGSYTLAEFIEIAFPAYQANLDHLEERFGTTLRRQPYPEDILVHRSDSIVEYETPAGQEGMGTYNWLVPGEMPIRGVAMLVGDTPDLIWLQTRLDSTDLGNTIIREAEQNPTRDQ